MSKKYPDDIIDKTIDFLKNHKYIDDVQFADRFIEINKNIKSKKQIVSKLYEKGIKKDIIDDAINKIDIDELEEAVAKKNLLKKCPNYYNITITKEEKNKLYGFLARKGFSYDTINKIMKIDM